MIAVLTATVLRAAGAWLEVLQNLLAAMQIPHRIVIGVCGAPWPPSPMWKQLVLLPSISSLVL